LRGRAAIDCIYTPRATTAKRCLAWQMSGTACLREPSAPHTHPHNPIYYVLRIYYIIYCPVSHSRGKRIICKCARVCVDPMCGGVVVGGRSGGPSCRLMNRTGAIGGRTKLQGDMARDE